MHVGSPRSIFRFAFAILVFLWLSGMSAHAFVRIYKVTMVGKATYFSSNSFVKTGYLVFDITNPMSSQVLEFKPRAKTYAIHTDLHAFLAPEYFNIFELDRNGDGFAEIEGGTSSFTISTYTNAVAYIGTIPKSGVRMGNLNITHCARILKGKGTLDLKGVDVFTRTDTLILDQLTIANVGNTDAGMALVIAHLTSKGFSPVP